jgi:hypothetical protein
VIRDQGRSRREGVEDKASPPVFSHLAGREQQDDGTPLAVGDDVQLGTQAALVRPIWRERAPLGRLAAVRCAMRCVASIVSRSGSPAKPASPAKMQPKMPSRPSAHKAVVQRLVASIALQRVVLAKAVSDHVQDALMSRQPSSRGTPCESGMKGTIRSNGARVSQTRSACWHLHHHGTSSADPASPRRLNGC